MKKRFFITIFSLFFLGYLMAFNAHACDEVEFVLTTNNDNTTYWALGEGLELNSILEQGIGSGTHTFCLESGSYSIAIQDPSGNGNGSYTLTNLTTQEVYGQGDDVVLGDSVNYILIPFTIEGTGGGGPNDPEVGACIYYNEFQNTLSCIPYGLESENSCECTMAGGFWRDDIACCNSILCDENGDPVECSTNVDCALNGNQLPPDPGKILICNESKMCEQVDAPANDTFIKKLVIQPIKMCESDGERCVEPDIESIKTASSKVFTQVGLKVEFLPFTQHNDSSIFSSNFTQVMSFFCNDNVVNGGNPNPSVLNIWFTNSIEPDNILGMSKPVGENGILINNSALEDWSPQYQLVLSHEIGHNLGLFHYGQSDEEYEDKHDNLMYFQDWSGSINDIYPDGELGRVLPWQADIIRMSQFLDCADKDGDGYFSGNGCNAPIDCDDDDTAVYPGAEEICGDWIDNNCDGQVDECNNPPIAIAGGPYLVAAEQSINLNSNGSLDPDGDPLSYSWSQSDDMGTFDDTSSPFPNYTGHQTGISELTLTVNDGIAQHSDTAIIVVYNPEDGFVTGGGWIYSLPGDDQLNLSAEGKATFGFVSKYKKGASIPIGNTEFKFISGELDFHSNNYKWLIVNAGGRNAQFKGSGTINGVGDYQFMVWAGDGAPDTFRIKIWEENSEGNETVRYDNEFNQAIEGGNIVIHKAK